MNNNNKYYTNLLKQLDILVFDLVHFSMYDVSIIR